MWFIGVEVEQEMSAPPPKKKSWIRPWDLLLLFLHRTGTQDFSQDESQDSP